MTASTFEAIALWSQVAGAIAFLVAGVLLFRKYLVPAVAANERARNEQLTSAEARRDDLRAQAEKAREELAGAEADAQTIAARGREDAEREREHLLAEARSEGERVLRNAEGELDRARLAASDRLRIEFIEKALLKARTEAPARLSAAANTQLVDAAVDTLSEGSR
jgi:F-type H+-transporting ATPase subunit b